MCPVPIRKPSPRVSNGVATPQVHLRLGPARDGGYYLIGARNLVPPVFEDVDWSTDDVLPQTITKLQDANISYSLLPPWLDIDTIDDFHELQQDLELSGHWLCNELNSLQQEFLS